LPFPLIVRATLDGQPLVNAPVRASMLQGSARLAATIEADALAVLDIRTDVNGLASVRILLGSAQHETNLIEFRAAAATATSTQGSLATPAPKVAAGDYHSLELDTDGTVWVWGDNSYGQLGDGSY